MKNITLTNGRTRRIIVGSILLLALSINSSGQLKDFSKNLVEYFKERFYPKADEEMLFRPAAYFVEVEYAVTSNISRTILTANLEIVYEEEIDVETWMNAPFGNTIEESVEVEAWMTAPFEVAFEEPVEVEAWMTAP
ncbi:MAG: hypothetical protein JXR52_09190, partial [Bacteroidales bacterium]|nr:hypothetical protein [Bacteroidales bacterium]